MPGHMGVGSRDDDLNLRWQLDVERGSILGRGGAWQQGRMITVRDAIKEAGAEGRADAGKVPLAERAAALRPGRDTRKLLRERRCVTWNEGPTLDGEAGGRRLRCR